MAMGPVGRPPGDGGEPATEETWPRPVAEAGTMGLVSGQRKGGQQEGSAETMLL